MWWNASMICDTDLVSNWRRRHHRQRHFNHNILKLFQAEFYSSCSSWAIMTFLWLNFLGIFNEFVDSFFNFKMDWKGLDAARQCFLWLDVLNNNMHTIGRQNASENWSWCISKKKSGEMHFGYALMQPYVCISTLM